MSPDVEQFFFASAYKKYIQAGFDCCGFSENHQFIFGKDKAYHQRKQHFAFTPFRSHKISSKKGRHEKIGFKLAVFPFFEKGKVYHPREKHLGLTPFSLH